ncbi:ubiquinone anaerobic biosynthesis protein UbiU [Aliikangiella coralliicola]|uniref:Ubiquinone biosynthesis protein UbiU n=1 Tax=Aliikangiella coralliicola TaxID=2592383 RepID=A0A545U4S8_9GAMM|nr:peptidase U32 family protein [Aliikangiella coralliicola]TQV84413.1 U32 family peptidase [Aliikangiella coralliicola]
MELICPAGNYQSLIKAVDHGANAVYIGLKNETNARHFSGLNFSEKQISKAIDYAHQQGCKVYCAINTFPREQKWSRWTNAVDQAMGSGIDTLIVADIGVMDYIRSRSSDFPIHLSVQASSTNLESLNFYHQQFAIRRAVLPRVLSLAQVEKLAKNAPVEIEVFGFGSLCIMAEGRCYLSSYMTGESPNTQGVCSPAAYVEWEDKGAQLESRLNGLLIDRFRENENAGYPTLCKGRFEVHGQVEHALEEPTSLNTMDILPQLESAGVAAIKIEGRQRSPAYVTQVTRAWRQAIDSLSNKDADGKTRQIVTEDLADLAEGKQTTIGAYERSWQ